jgi:hypothetical protein
MEKRPWMKNGVTEDLSEGGQWVMFLMASGIFLFVIYLALRTPIDRFFNQLTYRPSRMNVPKKFAGQRMKDCIKT